jgi:hypothetical protein
MKTNTKHTPGQWHIGSGNGEGSIFADNGRTRLEIGGTTLYPICQVNREWEDEEDEANARLIAAAPELLDAAKWASTIIAGYLSANSQEERNYTYKDLQHAGKTLAAAIAKATEQD